jgi:hypothetical protein
MTPDMLIRILERVKPGWCLEISVRNAAIGSVVLRAMPPEGERGLPVMLWAVD